MIVLDIGFEGQDHRDWSLGWMGQDHADHKTITLHGWHRVLMNTENQSRAMRNVAFLD